jgi:hypothetical protein
VPRTIDFSFSVQLQRNKQWPRHSTREVGRTILYSSPAYTLPNNCSPSPPLITPTRLTPQIPLETWRVRNINPLIGSLPIASAIQSDTVIQVCSSTWHCWHCWCRRHMGQISLNTENPLTTGLSTIIGFVPISLSDSDDLTDRPFWTCSCGRYLVRVTASRVRAFLSHAF